ncbi:MAG: hypothetical protein C3F02_02855 [Parcubacteria group bacterium]|nr:MAG: hypothetical protein C3F02_02855 [Parcubacteria group bacterium]
MIKNKFFWIALIFMLVALIIYLGTPKKTVAPGAPNTAVPETISYDNSQYGFSFALANSWRGYSVISSEWRGLTTDAQNGEVATTTGPLISIRHPLWTGENPRQDIPIMVLTIYQWNELQQDKFHIGAAPIRPSELGRNDKYVFALPARYNFAFPTGYEEVEQILQAKPLKAY